MGMFVLTKTRVSKNVYREMSYLMANLVPVLKPALLGSRCPCPPGSAWRFQIS